MSEAPVGSNLNNPIPIDIDGFETVINLTGVHESPADLGRTRVADVIVVETAGERDDTNANANDDDEDEDGT
jgi:hypothetical protein